MKTTVSCLRVDSSTTSNFYLSVPCNKGKSPFDSPCLHILLFYLYLGNCDSWLLEKDPKKVLCSSINFFFFNLLCHYSQVLSHRYYIIYTITTIISILQLCIRISCDYSYPFHKLLVTCSILVIIIHANLYINT